MIKAVIFDWGGVLAMEPSGGWAEEIAGLFGMEQSEVIENWKQLFGEFRIGKISDAEFWQGAARVFGKDVPDKEQTERAWARGSALDIYCEIKEYAEELRERGIRTAILSNNVEPVVELIRSRGGYEGFEPVLLSNETGLAKPDEKFYELILEKLGMEAEECVFVDDRAQNVEAAEKIGMKGVVAKNDPRRVMERVEAIIELS